jgi:8-amino-7-oxononanoate synthase
MLVDSFFMSLSMTPMPDSRNWFAPVAAHRRRRIPHLYRSDSVWVELDGRKLINFAANDYLGLASHAQICDAASRSVEAEGLGSGASRLVSGDAPEWRALESELADWKGYESALLLGSGMLTNMGLLDALADRHTQVFCDRLCHASLIDGARLCRGRMRRYRHLDMTQLARMLADADAGRRIIVSDGVFSMDGDCAPVGELVDLAERFDAIVVFDDAHGTGVLGPGGRGLAAEARLAGHPRLIEVGTLGKALGGYGAFVLGAQAVIDGLVQRLRTLMYSTALPPALAAAASCAVRLVREGSARERLQGNLAHFLRQAKRRRLPLMVSRTPIQPLMVGDDATALRAADQLRQAGFFVPAIRPPTVPEGTARLRITLSASHEHGQIDGLIDVLAGLSGEQR